MGTFRIGNVTLEHGVVLGPMAGYTSTAFRLLCRHYGAELCYTDMTLAGYVLAGDDGGPRYPRQAEGDRPLGVQLCGRDPDELARAARWCQDAGFDIVDLNLACPARKIVRKGYGGAMLGKPDEAVRFIETVRRAIDIPLTLKLRTGVRQRDDAFIDLGRQAERIGVQALILHPRSVHQRYTGRADWSQIARLVREVSVPVIGSGDVHTAQDAVAMLRQTGCAGVMIARGALGAPWVFRQTCALLATGRPGPPIPRSEQVRALQQHFHLLCRHTDTWHAVRLMRRAVVHYARRLCTGPRFRQAIARFETPDEFDRLMREFFAAEMDDVGRRPDDAVADGE